MRVITGLYGGRRLNAPEGMNTRPILDRVKVALFDWLGARLAMPGELPPLNVLDIFCGGGSLGIEALSRGAAHCTFVEGNRDAFKCLQSNLDLLKIKTTAKAILGSAESIIAAPPSGGGFGLVFLDPPYKLTEDFSPKSTMSTVLARLGSRIPVEPNVLALWRHSAESVLPEDISEGWRSSERRTWGNMAITLLERRNCESP